MIAASNPSDDVRAGRMIAALIEGLDLDAIAARERLPPKEAQTILREALGERWVAPLADFAKIQIARLENLCLHVMDRVDGGELAAVDRALRIFDRFDRYHGFNRAKSGSRALWRRGSSASDRQAQRGGGASRRAGRPFRMTDQTVEVGANSHSARHSSRPGQPMRRIGDILSLSLDKRTRLLGEMSPLECAQIYYDWTFWARPDQAPPPGDWIVWLILAGRGAGKTRAGAEAVRLWSQSYPNVNLIGPTADDVRDVMVLGELGHSQLLPQGRAPALSRLRREARMAERRDELPLFRRGARPAARQAAYEALVRRARRLARPDAFDQAMFGLRLGDKPQMVITTTPRPTKIIKQLAADKDTIVTRGSTSKTRAIWRAPSSSASPSATRGARSDGRS